jgi:hypothetical protein
VKFVGMGRYSHDRKATTDVLTGETSDSAAPTLEREDYEEA